MKGIYVVQEPGHIQAWGSICKSASLTIKIAVNHPAPVIVVVHGQHCTPCNAVTHQCTKEGSVMSMHSTPSRTRRPSLVGLKSMFLKHR